MPLCRLPFQKIITLIIRTFSKPMLQYARKKHAQNQMRFFNWIFIWIGRNYHLGEQFINNRILKTSRKTKAAELKEDIALEKGIEAFYEFWFYVIVIGIPLYEMHKGSVAAEEKEKVLNKKLEGMEANLE